MDAGFYRGNEPMVQLNILGWPSLDDLNAGAELARITDTGARFDAVCLGFVTGGNAAGVSASTGAMPTGLPRRCGCMCCSAEAK